MAAGKQSTKNKNKARTKTLMLINESAKLKELKKEINQFQGVPIDSIKPIVVDEVIPKEDVEIWSREVPVVLDTKKEEKKAVLRELKAEPKKEQPPIADITFIEFEKIEIKKSTLQPVEVERLIEYKTQTLQQEEQKFNLFPSEKLDYLIVPSINLELNPKEHYLELEEKKVQFIDEKKAKIASNEVKEKEIDFVQKTEKAEQLYFQDLEKDKLNIYFAKQILPTYKIIELKEKEGYLLDLKIEDIKKEGLELKKESKSPAEVKINLEEKEQFVTPLYFEEYKNIEILKVWNIGFLQPKPKFYYTELKLIEEPKAKEIKPVEHKTKIFDIEEIEKYLEVGEEKQKLKTEKEPYEKKEEKRIEKIELDKRELEEYNRFFLIQTNIIDFLENDPTYYYEKLPEWAKEFFEIVKMEQKYWQLVKKREEPDYKKQKEIFVNEINLLSPEQRIWLEKMITSSKALASLVLIFEQNKNEQIIQQTEKIYKQLIQKHPDIKPLVEYRFSKYIFIKTFDKENIEPPFNLKLILENFDERIALLTYCWWIILFDQIMKNSKNKKLVEIIADCYRQMMIKKPEISRELKEMKIINNAILNFFVEERIENITIPSLKEIVVYEITYLINQMYNKRREVNG
ncbi:MAG: hypothetical protein N3D10_02825 [Candidatus Micrarchaeota archaeon]|nr:hypothetical protein [Candidatus Micrarchaeota archaeon]